MPTDGDKTFNTRLLYNSTALKNIFQIKCSNTTIGINIIYKATNYCQNLFAGVVEICILIACSSWLNFPCYIHDINESFFLFHSFNHFAINCNIKDVFCFCFCFVIWQYFTIFCDMNPTKMKVYFKSFSKSFSTSSC